MFTGPSVSTVSSAKNIISVASGETTFHSKDINNVAYYSSIGPAHDGRIKPDIVAPGDALLSASAHGTGGSTCATTEKSGTSMASPAAAGAAALIRQYFMNDKYWSAVCNPNYYECRAFPPTGVLMKALVLHSGTAMQLWNGDRDKIKLGDPPDIYQGYGRMFLQNLLPFPSSAMDLYVRDKVSLKQNSKKDYYLHIESSSHPIK